MLLAIDVGNTRIKVAVFEQHTLLETFAFSKKLFAIKVSAILKQYPTATDIILAAVGTIDKEFFLTEFKDVNVHFVSTKDHFPFQNLYKTPQTLGIDRMVLAAGAVWQFPKQNRLIIDAGTCITYDFVDEDNNYLGGAISPGLTMRYKSLHQYTAKLPLLTIEIPTGYIGNSTHESIHSGVVNGLTHEIDGFIEQYQRKYSNFIIILTGGDAEFLAKRLKNTIFANSNFLLESLNQTFQYKIKND